MIFFSEFINGIQLLGHSVYGKEFLYTRCVVPQLFGELVQGAMVPRLLSVLVFVPKEWKTPLLGILKSWRVLQVLNTKQHYFLCYFPDLFLLVSAKIHSCTVANSENT